MAVARDGDHRACVIERRRRHRVVDGEVPDDLDRLALEFVFERRAGMLGGGRDRREAARRVCRDRAARRPVADAVHGLGDRGREGVGRSGDIAVVDAEDRIAGRDGRAVVRGDGDAVVVRRGDDVDANRLRRAGEGGHRRPAVGTRRGTGAVFEVAVAGVRAGDGVGRHIRGQDGLRPVPGNERRVEGRDVAEAGAVLGDVEAQTPVVVFLREVTGGVRRAYRNGGIAARGDLEDPVRRRRSVHAQVWSLAGGEEHERRRAAEGRLATVGRFFRLGVFNVAAHVEGGIVDDKADVVPGHLQEGEVHVGVAHEVDEAGRLVVELVVAVVPGRVLEDEADTAEGRVVGDPHVGVVQGQLRVGAPEAERGNVQADVGAIRSADEGDIRRARS